MTDLDRLDALAAAANYGKPLNDDELRAMAEAHRRKESLVESHLCVACGDTWPCEVLAVVLELQSARKAVRERDELRAAAAGTVRAMLDTDDRPDDDVDSLIWLRRLRAALHREDGPVTPGHV